MMARLDNMWLREEEYRKQGGVALEMRNYIAAANGEARLAIYAKYMQPREIDSMRKHFQRRAHEWPQLINAVREQMRADPSPLSPAARELARQWFELFTDMVGSEPDARLRFRQAMKNEPALHAGRLMTDEVLEYLRRAPAGT